MTTKLEALVPGTLVEQSFFAASLRDLFYGENLPTRGFLNNQFGDLFNALSEAP